MLNSELSGTGTSLVVLLLAVRFLGLSRTRTGGAYRRYTVCCCSHALPTRRMQSLSSATSPTLLRCAERSIRWTVAGAAVRLRRSTFRRHASHPSPTSTSRRRTMVHQSCFRTHTPHTYTRVHSRTVAITIPAVSAHHRPLPHMSIHPTFSTHTHNVGNELGSPHSVLHFHLSSAVRQPCIAYLYVGQSRSALRYPSAVAHCTTPQRGQSLHRLCHQPHSQPALTPSPFSSSDRRPPPPSHCHPLCLHACLISIRCSPSPSSDTVLGAQ